VTKIGSPKVAIQGYAAQAALLPMAARAKPMALANTIFSADAGYHNTENLEALCASQTPAMIADGLRGRALYSKRIDTVEPVFANIRHKKRMNRFTLRGQ
jgi:Transposase DDE domain